MQTIEQIAENLKQDPKVCGILLTGSHARGEATSGSDIDFWVLLRDVLERRFRAEAIGEHWVELHFRNFSQAKAKMQQNPIELYSHLDGKILYDPDYQLGQLLEFAQQQFENYQQPETERKDLTYWLATAQRKLKAALEQSDTVRMGYLASTNSWKILEGLWAANHKPMPPSGSIGYHLGKLELPFDSSEVAHLLFDAPTETRAKTALDLIAWVLPRLE